MNLNVRNIIIYLLFLGLGIYLFINVYKEYEMERFVNVLKQTNYYWLSLSLALSIISHLLRALRWNLLINPLGYKPKLKNSFIAVLLMYCVNILIPRAGEVARCGVLKKYDKVPFSSLVGTVVIERIADIIVLGLITVYVIVFYNADILSFFNHNQNNLNGIDEVPITKMLLLLLVLIAAGLLTIRLLMRSKKFGDKVSELVNSFINGIKSILQLKQKWLFIFYSLAIFATYLIMLYLIFFAYPPTAHLSLGQGIVTFFLSALAMLAPIQAGMGAWHFMVVNTLVIYNIPRDVGLDFALLAHTSTNLIYLVIGFVAYLFLPLLNQRN